MARSLDSGKEPPDDGGMSDRISRLEQLAADTNRRLGALELNVATMGKDVAALNEDVAVIRSNYVTKEDLYTAINAQTWRLVTFVCGFGTALVTATYFIVSHTR